MTRQHDAETGADVSKDHEAPFPSEVESSAPIQGTATIPDRQSDDPGGAAGKVIKVAVDNRDIHDTMPSPLLPIVETSAQPVDASVAEQSSSPPLPATDSSPKVLSIFIALALVLYIAYRVSRRRQEHSSQRMLTSEELRRLRESHLETYLATASTEQSSAKASILDANQVAPVENKPQEEPSAPRKKELTHQQVSAPVPRLKGTRAALVRTVQPRKWQPIRTVDDLCTWTPPSVLSDRPVPLLTRKSNSSKQLMLCHDMAGNYAEDAFQDGWYASSPLNAKDSWAWGFRPCHFAFTEAFIYFSHEFLSIPPRGWIDAAHKHGTKVLGTFLTEWDTGAKLCQEVFADRATVETVARKMSEIRKTLGFEGWLINIENPVAREMIPLIERFLEVLSIEGDLVTWYDSIVSDTGELKWQNGLNERNLDFFKRVNYGILTNYGWNEERVQVSNTIANSLGKGLVWHGIDVFGRGTFGNGGMQCDLALNVLDKYKSNAACLFAPGWVLESACERDPMQGKTKWHEFFSNILSHTSWGEMESSSLTIKLDVTKRGFLTDFCDGGGFTYWSNGEKLASLPWMDLRRQSIQPRWDVITPGELDDMTVKTQKRVTIRNVDHAPIFMGSSTIQLVGRRLGVSNESWFFFPLVSVESRLGGEQGPGSKLRVKAAVLPLNGDVAFCLDIAAREPSKPLSRLKLVPKGYAMEDTLPAIEERLERGWTIRTWELRTNDLRGRCLLGIGVSALPISAALRASSWMDVRLGMVSLDETMKDCSGCCPEHLVLNKESLSLTWQCAAGCELGDCSTEHVLVFVNGKFRQCAFGGQTQLRELTVLPLGQVEDVVTLKAVRWDGSISDEVTVSRFL